MRVYGSETEFTRRRLRVSVGDALRTKILVQYIFQQRKQQLDDTVLVVSFSFSFYSIHRPQLLFVGLTKDSNNCIIYLHNH